MGIQIISENRKAWHEYEIIEKYEAGLVLMGSEVKSLRAKQVSLKDSYLSFRGDEAYLQNAHIAEYKQSSQFTHEPERLRKVLLNRSELNEIYGALREKGLTCVPLKIYFKEGRAKVELALVKGKKQHDKREAIKKRDVALEMKKSLQRNKRG
ncbi:MAG: SsrA-binding protein SmpB [Proteobacteria bacterium]|jgi:SsrA-binding protein|nr:SsrA-binding protein SmpB [Pseudomonadota bacterium]